MQTDTLQICNERKSMCFHVCIMRYELKEKLCGESLVKSDIEKNDSCGKKTLWKNEYEQLCLEILDVRWVVDVQEICYLADYACFCFATALSQVNLFTLITLIVLTCPSPWVDETYSLYTLYCAELELQ